MNVGDKLNLKYCISDDNMRQDKHTKFNEEITILGDNIMVLKGFFQGDAHIKFSLIKDEIMVASYA